MPRIRMLRDDKGSLDGFTVTYFLKDLEYDVTEDLAKAFIGHMGVAEIVRVRKAEPEAPENKMVKDVPENKVAGTVSAKTEEEAEAVSGKSREENSTVTRVYQLADELGIPSKKVIKKARALGISIKVAQSGLTEEEAEKIRAGLAK